MLNGFGTVVSTLGIRTKPYLPQICGTILWRLNNKAAKVNDTHNQVRKKDFRDPIPRKQQFLDPKL